MTTQHTKENEMETKTLLEVYCELKGWQGGTIHQMHEDFKQMSMREKDTLCGKMMDRKNDIFDYENISWFMKERLDASGIVISGVQS